jgi:hypothetical protein
MQSADGRDGNRTDTRESLAPTSESWIAPTGVS